MRLSIAAQKRINKAVKMADVKEPTKQGNISDRCSKMFNRDKFTNVKFLRG